MDCSCKKNWRFVSLPFIQEKCTKDNGHEDVEVGKCLHTAGVDSHNTVDIFGRESFHPLTPSVHINGPIPSNQIPQDRFLMVSVSIL